MFVLLQHKALFLVVFLGSLPLAAASAVYKPVQYEYQVSLEIGGCWSSKIDGKTFAGSFHEFESPESVASRVTTEKGERLVTVVQEADIAQGELARTLLSKVAERIIADHEALLAELKRLRNMNI